MKISNLRNYRVYKKRFTDTHTRWHALRMRQIFMIAHSLGIGEFYPAKGRIHMIFAYVVDIAHLMNNSSFQPWCPCVPTAIFFESDFSKSQKGDTYSPSHW